MKMHFTVILLLPCLSPEAKKSGFVSNFLTHVNSSDNVKQAVREAATICPRPLQVASRRSACSRWPSSVLYLERQTDVRRQTCIVA